MNLPLRSVFLSLSRCACVVVLGTMACSSNNTSGPPKNEGSPDASVETNEPSDPVVDSGAPDVSEKDSAPGIPVEYLSCDSPAGGIPWSDSNDPEQLPGFEAELAGMDFTSLPDVLDMTVVAPIFRAVIGHALETDPLTIDKELPKSLALSKGLLGRTVLAGFKKKADAGQKGVDFYYIRRGLHRYYNCSRPLPSTLEAFRQSIWDYTTTQGEVVNSVPKRGPRRIRKNSAKGIYVAETLVNGEVRETEALIAEGRADGQLDFVVYGKDGKMMDRSEFGTAGGGMRVSATPYACMACHYDNETKKIDSLLPAMGMPQ